MSRDEIVSQLRANIDRLVRVTFEGGEDIQDVIIKNLDQEGFVNERDGQLFWATFEDVENLEPLSGKNTTRTSGSEATDG